MKSVKPENNRLGVLKEEKDKLSDNDLNKKLINDLIVIIDESKKRLAISANLAITMTYWFVGKRINEDVLNNNRAEYGKKIVVLLGRQLSEKFGRSFKEKNLRRMMQFASIFPDEQFVVSLGRQLSWTHFRTIIPIKDDLKREFYLQMSRAEQWNVKTLRAKIDGLLFERTAISKKPKTFIKEELKSLRNNKLTPDLVFRDPYFLDFAGLKGSYSEKSLEDAIIKELHNFILELGSGFAFIEQQKRMLIDGEDFYLDLLFYHRKLKRLVAIELKLGKFKAQYKGQMELYLRWLEKYEMQDNEKSPLGLILCAEGNHEQIELLQLENAGIRTAEYLTELPDKKLLKEKLHLTIQQSKIRFENNEK